MPPWVGSEGREVRVQSPPNPSTGLRVSHSASSWISEAVPGNIVNILPSTVCPCRVYVTESHTVSRILTHRPGLPSPGCLSKVAALLTIGFPSAPPPHFLSSPEGNNTASCGERLGFLGLEGVRALSYDPLPVWTGPAVITPGSRALSRELGSGRCWGGPPSLAPAQGRETRGGQLFTAPTDVSHFFLAPWKL